jgi:hypothetical protein
MNTSTSRPTAYTNHRACLSASVEATVLGRGSVADGSLANHLKYIAVI